jgi:hypothetical protein
MTRLRNYFRDIKDFVNPNELIIDISIVLFYWLLNTFVVHPGKSLLTIFKPIGLGVLILLIDVAVPMYLTTLRANIVAGVVKLKKFISVLLTLVVISTCAMLGFFLPIILHIHDYLDEFTFLLLLVVGIVAVLLSAASGDHDPGEEKNESLVTAILHILMMILLVITVLVGLVYMITFFVNGPVLYGFLCLAGIILGPIGIAALSMYGFKKLIKSTPVENYILPIMIMLLVIIWQELFKDVMTGSRLSDSPAGLIVFAFSGVLPVRLMIACEPPVKIINVIVAILALIYIYFL